MQILRNASLLQQVGKNQYAFFHSSLIEYFVTRDLYEYPKVDEKQSKQIETGVERCLDATVYLD